MTVVVMSYVYKGSWFVGLFSYWVWFFEEFLCVMFFFFKQKTAYEMLRSLVGSEMCIRDRPDSHLIAKQSH